MDRTRMDRALERLQKLASDNAPYGARVTAEARYAEAYQELVRAGEAPQIREKYRSRKSSTSRSSGSSGNAGTSAGKHSPHPDVPGYRRHGYKCEPKWNTKAKEEKS